MIVFNGEKESVSELERNFRIDENVIRFLTSRTDNIPSEPTPIMKYKIEKENLD
jgi:ribosomal protein S6